MMEVGFYRGVASIPSRRSLNVQLGPTATTDEDDEQSIERPRSTLEPAAISAQRSPRRRFLPQVLQQQQQLLHPPALPQQHQRVRWSRMTLSTPMAVPEPELAAAASAAASAAAGLCQLVDIGETRDLIRRHREAAKKLAEVNSIVTHLSLEKENDQEPRAAHPAGWATFRGQPNSQFKQYVFQTPSRDPHLPAADPQQQPQRPERSRTTLGLVTGRTAARHTRPEPLGGGRALRRELTTAAAASVGDRYLPREASQLSGLSGTHRAGRFNGQGHSSTVQPADSDSTTFYGQFERRRAKNFRLD